jgi:hypothetical protein
LFPDGIFYDTKNNQYLTRNTNKFIELVACLSSSCEDIKKEDYQNLLEKSSLVPEGGQLSNRVVMDLMEFCL